MKVLVVGGGGREHALAWKIAGDPRAPEVFAAPGSDAIAAVAECVAIQATDIAGLAAFAERERIDLTVVGPEAPLAAGIVDEFRGRGLRIFGPDRAGAQLEASKAFTKRLLVEAGVPTAAYGEFSEPAAARDFARSLGFPLVVKADGLAAGKGVVICADAAEADRAIEEMLEGGAFGEAGRRIVVEEFLAGEEASFMAITDGRTALALATSQDHKRIFDGDRGPNTGGMGAYSPAPVVTAQIHDEVMRRVIEPTVAALAARGIDFRGVLYAGLMISPAGVKVLEYNVRFGDPECQAIMLRLRSSLIDLLEAAIDRRLDQVRPQWDSATSVCVVMAAPGYPGEVRKGDVIDGLDLRGASAKAQVFHSGTRRDGERRWVTAGGRVLGVCASGARAQDAVAKAYDAVAGISWDGVQFRRDIAWRAIERERQR
ncbi:MAG: phosphoribosylamine--glycine ligase [Deltaproteobacteria bacterium]|nr:phosphoribosylamine--glycine ligase [Deltaproteobacteria bacterium]